MSKNICCMNEMYTFDSIMKTREQHAMHVLYGAEVERIRDLTIGETGPRGYISVFSFHGENSRTAVAILRFPISLPFPQGNHCYFFICLKRKFYAKNYFTPPVPESCRCSGGMSLLRPVWSLSQAGAPENGGAVSGTVTWVPSICNFCSSFCDIHVATKEIDGVKRAVKIEGNKESPLNRGRICARGQAGLYQTYDPDRLKQPLIRVEGSKRGEWNFRAATWDEAYSHIIGKMKKVNPWEISLVGGWTACVSYMHFSLPFCQSLQIPNIVASPFSTV